jgi:hypothetical protein
MMNYFRRHRRVLCGAIFVFGSLAGAAESEPPDVDPAQMAALASEFPAGSKLRVTPHYLVVYDTAEAITDSRLRLLEKVREAFYTQLEHDGFTLRTAEKRLVCVLFRRYDNYLRYAATTEATGVAGSGGFYSTGTNRIAIFDNRSNPRLKASDAAEEQVRVAVEQIQSQIDRAGRSGDRNRVEHLMRSKTIALQNLSELQSRTATSSGLNDIATTFHEATHQFAFNSGLQSPVSIYPFWVTEGLATCFETMNPALPVGPREDNANRRPGLVSAVKRGKLKPLAEFVVISRLKDAQSADTLELYAQAWGLFRFLYTTRLDQFRPYMARLFLIGASGGDPEVMTRTFTAAFGPIDQVEKQWREWAGQLQQ